MAKQLLPDELWSILEPLIPKEPPKPKGGRPRVSDRAALTGILFVLRTGIPWEYLPNEMGCGSGMTCWRRLRDWQEAGVWKKLHRGLLAKLEESEHIDWEKVCIDASAVPAPGGAKKQARTRATAQSRARSATLWSTPKASR